MLSVFKNCVLCSIKYDLEIEGCNWMVVWGYVFVILNV